ncbi:MAG: hypothetical protein ABI707_14010 [Ferruginibacter sp.]
MKPGALVFLIFCSTFISCTRDEVKVQVVRHATLKFDLNNNESWTATTVAFGPVSKVVVYPNDTTSQAIVYNRLTVNSTGRSTNGQNLQFILSFDVTDPVEFKGQYTPTYSITKGLAQVQLYNVTNSNNLSAYSLCADNFNKSQFQIERQDKNERLISGVFQMTLCNTRDSTEKISILNGTFTDIRY